MQSYSRLRLVGSVVLMPQPLFSCSVLCAFVWACNVRCLPFLDSVLFSASRVDQSWTMHIFGASSLAAAVNTLNGGVFKRRRSLTAIPGLHLVQRPIAKYYSSISPATSAALSSYLPTRTAVLFSLISVTLSLLTFCISFTLFRRQWTRLFAHPQRFFRGTSGRFLHIVEDSQPTASDTSFLYLSVTEFKALQALAREALHRTSLNVPLTPTETINITNNPTNNTPIVSAPVTNVPQRAYPLISAPIYSAPSN